MRGESTQLTKGNHMMMKNFIRCRLRLMELKEDLKDLEDSITDLTRTKSDKKCEEILKQLATMLCSFHALRNTLEVSKAKAESNLFSWEKFFEESDLKYREKKLKRWKRRFLPVP
jgi:Mg2+ and Co2+ transporter CorA